MLKQSKFPEIDLVRNRLNIEGATERIDPDREPPGILSIHLKRYEFSKPYAFGKKVLDAACGVGYGTAYLAQVARHVTGIDINSETIAHAKEHYQTECVTFHVMDVTKTDFSDGAFDTICSFETIEHLQNIEGYLREVARLLSPKGTYLVSTPQAQKTNHRPHNPYHTIEFSRSDFEILLHQYFSEVEIYGQRRRQSELHYQITRLLDVTGLRGRLPRLDRYRDLVNKTLKTSTFDIMSLEDQVISKEKIERASEFIAVCRKPKK